MPGTLYTRDYTRLFWSSIPFAVHNIPGMVENNVKPALKTGAALSNPGYVLEGLMSGVNAGIGG